MQLKFLKAGTGDSILIHHNSHNILIDGGNDSKYLLIELDNIYQKGEVLDLLVITHHDEDHIKGIIDLLKILTEGKFGDQNTFIKRVIFNSSKKILETQSKERLLSYKQAQEVEELLLGLDISWEVSTDQREPMFFDDLKIDFLSPTKEDLDKYIEDKSEYLSSDFKCDWETSMWILEKYIDDDSLDMSSSNKSSIVIKVECEGKKILLTGDTTPDRLENIINKLSKENNGDFVSFDYFKLPHHGSYRSLNKAIIEKVSCINYIISTNSKKHFLPNKRALLKLLKFLKRDKEKINFIFNYEEALVNLQITEKEKKDFNFVLTPNDHKYGISI